MLKRMFKKKNQCPEHVATGSSSSPTLLSSNWANLSEDILDEILKKMCYVDLSTFGSVCKSWRLMCIDRFSCLSRNIPLGVPILLSNAYKPDSNSRKFIKTSGELASDEIFMPEAANKWVCGSSWGWLVLAGAGIDGVEVSLLNAFTRRVIQLPSINTFTMRLNFFREPDDPLDYCFSYIHKAILSTNPAISEQDCIIMAIVGTRKKLSYCRIGDKRWSSVDDKCCLRALCDVIYYEEKFYATNKWGTLMSCDIIDPNSIEIVSMGTHLDSDIFTRYYYMRYLVVVFGHLLLVSRTRKHRFEVHLLKKRNSSFVERHFLDVWVPNEVEIWHEWVEIESIGDQLLFIGNNNSFSVPSPRHNGKANCIYFTGDTFSGMQGGLYNYYFGRYDIAKKSTRIYYGEHDDFLPSFWVTPTPW